MLHRRDLYEMSSAAGTQIISVEISSPSPEFTSLLAVTVLAGVFLLGILGFLVTIIIKRALYVKQFPEVTFFRTHSAIYVISLLVFNVAQAASTVMNVEWIVKRNIQVGHFCTTQSIVKQTGDVGAALSSLVILAHIFNVAFFRINIRSRAAFGIVTGVWLLTAAVIVTGPAFLQDSTGEKGPIFGISGFTCGISRQYWIAQFLLDGSSTSLVIALAILFCPMIFLRTRGTLVAKGWCIGFRSSKSDSLVQAESENTNVQLMALVKVLIWYPVTYAILMVPTVLCQLAIILKFKLPYQLMVVASAFISFSGFVNAVLLFATPTTKYLTMRFALPLPSPSSDRSFTSADARKSPAIGLNLPADGWKVDLNPFPPKEGQAQKAQKEAEEEEEEDSSIAYLNTPDPSPVRAAPAPAPAPSRARGPPGLPAGPPARPTRELVPIMKQRKPSYASPPSQLRIPGAGIPDPSRLPNPWSPSPYVYATPRNVNVGANVPAAAPQRNLNLSRAPSQRSAVSASSAYSQEGEWLLDTRPPVPLPPSRAAPASSAYAPRTVRFNLPGNSEGILQKPRPFDRYPV